MTREEKKALNRQKYGEPGAGYTGEMTREQKKELNRQKYGSATEGTASESRLSEMTSDLVNYASMLPGIGPAIGGVSELVTGKPSAGLTTLRGALPNAVAKNLPMYEEGKQMHPTSAAVGDVAGTMAPSVIASIATGGMPLLGQAIIQGSVSAGQTGLFKPDASYGDVIASGALGAGITGALGKAGEVAKTAMAKQGLSAVDDMNRMYPKTPTASSAMTPKKITPEELYKQYKSTYRPVSAIAKEVAKSTAGGALGAGVASAFGVNPYIGAAIGGGGTAVWNRELIKEAAKSGMKSAAINPTIYGSTQVPKQIGSASVPALYDMERSSDEENPKSSFEKLIDYLKGASPEEKRKMEMERLNSQVGRSQTNPKD